MSSEWPKKYYLEWRYDNPLGKKQLAFQADHVKSLLFKLRKLNLKAEDILMFYQNGIPLSKESINSVVEWVETNRR